MQVVQTHALRRNFGVADSARKIKRKQLDERAERAAVKWRRSRLFHFKGGQTERPDVSSPPVANFVAGRHYSETLYSPRRVLSNV